MDINEKIEKTKIMYCFMKICVVVFLILFIIPESENYQKTKEKNLLVLHIVILLISFCSCLIVMPMIKKPLKLFIMDLLLLAVYVSSYSYLAFSEYSKCNLSKINKEIFTYETNKLNVHKCPSNLELSSFPAFHINESTIEPNELDTSLMNTNLNHREKIISYIFGPENASQQIFSTTLRNEYNGKTNVPETTGALDSTEEPESTDIFESTYTLKSTGISESTEIPEAIAITNMSETTGTSESTAGTHKPTFGKLESTGTLDSKTCTLDSKTGHLESTTGTLESTTGTLESTTGTLESTTGMLESTTGTLESTSGSIVSTTIIPFKKSSEKSNTDLNCTQILKKIIVQTCFNLFFQLIAVIIGGMYIKFMRDSINTVDQVGFHQTNDGKGEVNLGFQANKDLQDLEDGLSQPSVEIGAGPSNLHKAIVSSINEASMQNDRPEIIKLGRFAVTKVMEATNQNKLIKSRSTKDLVKLTRDSVNPVGQVEFHQTNDGIGVVNLGFQANDDVQDLKDGLSQPSVEMGAGPSNLHKAIVSSINETPMQHNITETN